MNSIKVGRSVGAPLYHMSALFPLYDHDQDDVREALSLAGYHEPRRRSWFQILETNGQSGLRRCPRTLP